ncbi:hypothetical protein LTR49_026090 [Elasticomyces elasticus]|nr:hypothetical protein LTR49_026090 [Elasticomyces elasticus]
MQEIQSSRSEYLPSIDSREWHLPGLEGLFDRQFRLLREDTVGQLRDAAKTELERLQDPDTSTNYKQKRQTARTFVYHDTEIVDLAFDTSSGMEMVIAFNQPKELQHKSTAQRREWWEGSKRLGHEALTCLLNAEGSVTFFVVSPPPFNMSKDTIAVPLHQQYNLWLDDRRAYTVVRPIMHGETSKLLGQLLWDVGQDSSLVEFPGVLLPAFRSTLEAMQSMSEALDMPFGDILAPLSTSNSPDLQFSIMPPVYATTPNFRFDLSSITSGGSALHLVLGTNIDDTIDRLTRRSTLDRGQAQAVVQSLSRSLALIQGPPGTGKSYTGIQLIKVLLANKLAGGLGPIICVCFTNHALDQGLERLIDEGVQRVVRIGGNSKSECLVNVNLREVSQRLELTKIEKSDRWRLKVQTQREVEEINHLLSRTGQTRTDHQIEAHLAAQYPQFRDQLFVAVDEDGFTKMQRRRGKVIDDWLKAAPWGFEAPRTVDELLDVDVHEMSGNERLKLYTLWLADIRIDLLDKLHIAMASYNQAKAQLDAVCTEQKLRVLKQSNIIGLTTSGLARNLDLIRRTGAKVLLCEEAGEVLEAHLLTALLPSIEHAILIGDHQQLRPHVQNNNLSTESRLGAQYSLDISLFERLVQPQDILAQAVPFSILSIQRRMHPSISQLVRKTLYSHLQDAPSVDYPEVMGMRHRLFWLHHEHKENGDKDTGLSLSHTNDYEVEMVAALVKHLVSQGVYSTKDIAVITPYQGQLRKIRKSLSATFNIILYDRDIEDLRMEADVDTDTEHNSTEISARLGSSVRGTLLQALRAATVDNFQGEEAKIVIVSLVRSNANHEPGFLRTSNRVNVLLSRAQHGMYVVGDANTMSHVPMWANILDILMQQGLFGRALELCCPRHRDTPLQVTMPDDFVRIAPEAGCDLPCEKQLMCGHACCPSLCGEVCPDVKFCQQCGSEEVKAIQADMVMFETYGSLDLEEEPCIFTPCGHVFSLSSMDGIMDMSKHYETNPTSGKITSLKTTSEPFSSDELKVCPICRSPLRKVARYGRIVRRAFLDESTKKLIAWSNRTHTELSARLANDQEEILTNTRIESTRDKDLTLRGSLEEQLTTVKKLKISRRYRKLFSSRSVVQLFADKLRKDEQPYQRVHDMMETLRRSQIGADNSMKFHFPSSELQLREYLQATSLLIRCDLILYSDVVVVHMKQGAARAGTVSVETTAQRARCQQLITDAQHALSVHEEAEGQLFWAKFAAIECGTFDVTLEGVAPDDFLHNEKVNAEAIQRLNNAETVCLRFKGPHRGLIEGLMEEVLDARRMLNEGVSTSEMRMVVTAMAKEFSGTGHWYRCANGHPFTVGECGMPMQLARCPACGAGIGGQHHRSTDGVQAVHDIERQFGRLAI